jgi:peptide/nickel transport system substrate-binding protein
VQAMKTGEVDYIMSYFVSLNDYETIKSDPNLKLVTTHLPPNILLGFFNVKKPPFDNPAIRKALFRVIDRNFIWKAVFAGVGQPATSPFPKQLKWVADGSIDYDSMYALDMEAANKALDDAGLEKDSNGIRFSTSIIFEADNPERLQTATILKDTWAKVGVNVELIPLENAVGLPRVYLDNNFDVFIVSYNSYGDPALGLTRIWDTTRIKSQWGNASTYSNPEVDRLFQEAARLSSLEERAPLYSKAQQILANDMPTMAFHENVRIDAASKKLHGVWGYEGQGRWYNAWLGE